MRTGQRPVRPIPQPVQAADLVPGQPGMHRLPRHTEPCRDLSNGRTIANHGLHGLIPLLYH